jgi:hypothetical protein
MTRRLPLRLAALLALTLPAACVDPAALQSGAGLASDPRECTAQGGGPASGGGCRFRNTPLELGATPVTLPARPWPFFPMLREVDFQDGTGQTWVAPARTLTDGASVPPVFVPIVGDPRTPEFALAAALHDAYCGVGNEAGPVFHGARWQDVHRMFYDTLIAGGTAPVTAKVMFAAVWLGGPRWYPVSKAPDTRLDRLPDSDRRDAMRAAKALIEREDPPLPVLILFLEQQERDMFRRLHETRDNPQGAAENPGGPGYPGGGGPVGPYPTVTTAN